MARPKRHMFMASWLWSLYQARSPSLYPPRVSGGSQLVRLIGAYISCEDAVISELLPRQPLLPLQYIPSLPAALRGRTAITLSARPP